MFWKDVCVFTYSTEQGRTWASTSGMSDFRWYHVISLLFFAFKWLIIEFIASCFLCFLKNLLNLNFVLFQCYLKFGYVLKWKIFLTVPYVWTLASSIGGYRCYFSEPSRKCAYYVFSLCFIIKICTVTSLAINKLRAHCDVEL